MSEGKKTGSRVPLIPMGRYAFLGVGAGLALGVFDFLVFQALGVSMMLGKTDVTLPVGIVFALTYAVLGLVIGGLVEARQQLKNNAETIAGQLEQLEATQRRLTEAETLAAVGRLAAGVAHEVRNPLGVIRSAAMLLTEDLPADSDSQRAGQFITEEVDRLNRYVGKLLDFSRPLKPELRPTDLVELAEAARNQSAESFDGSVELRLSTRSPTLVAQADPDLISQLLLGLITNAAQAIEHAGRIELRLYQEQTRGCIEVADSGPGVADEMRDQLFEPFATTRSDGTGLGLAMAARVVRFHGGVIESLDKRGLRPAGGGACFLVSLPLTPETIGES